MQPIRCVFALLFTLLLILDSSVSASSSIIIRNDTDEQAHICYNYNISGTRFSYQQCYSIPPGGESKLLTCHGCSLPILGDKRHAKHLQLEGGPYEKINSGRTYFLSKMRTGSKRSTVPEHHIALYNDQQKSMRFILHYDKNNAIASETVTLKPGSVHLFHINNGAQLEIDQSPYYLHFVTQKKRYYASELMGVPGHCYKVINDTKEKVDILHHYMINNTGHECTHTLDAGECEVHELMELDKLQVLPHHKRTIKGGEIWKVSELKHCE